MQGKGVVKFFLVVMLLVTLVQFLFNLPTRKVEKNAEVHARSIANPEEGPEQRAAYKAAKTAFLDSMSSEKIFRIPLLKSYTYQELKGQQLALGLDLKGGMSVVLQVDLREFIQALAKDSKDPTFLKALEQATEAQKSAQADFVTLFADAWKEVAKSKTMYSVFRKNETFISSANLNLHSSDGDVTRAIRQKANETVDLTFKLLKERIDKLGVTQPNVSLDVGRDLIIVELPGIDNPERARNFLQAAAKLEFWNVYRTTDANPSIRQALIVANDKLKKMEKGEEEDVRSFSRIDTVFATDSLGNIDSTKIVSTDTIFDEQSQDQGPLFDLLQLGGGGLAVMGTAEKNKRKPIMEMLERPGIKELFPKSMKFLWSKNPVNYSLTDKPEGDYYELYAMKLERGKQTAPLEGDHVTSASASPDPSNGQMQVSLSMDQTGAQIWGRMTQKAFTDNNRQIAIVLDDEVVSAPRVNSPILNGNSSISGSFTAQEANDLAKILEIGKLPARTKIIQESLVGPSLGADNINRSIEALSVGFLLVLAFMILYYGGAGIVSILALFLNLFFIFGALASFGTVLTLPGIAGIVLTIGMAVDANVIIYERVREELRAGKSVLMSIQGGFSQSYSAIIDANVTTILTAFVLAYFGLGPIKGFAVVLIIGVLSSLFTAVLVGKMMIDWWVKKDRGISFWTGVSKNAFTKVNIDWIGNRKIAYTISGTIILAGLVSMLFFRGFDLGVDFKGGYSYNVEFAEGQKLGAEALRNALTPVFDGKVPVVKAVDTENTFNVVTDYLIDDDADDAQDRVMVKLHEGIQAAVAGNLDFNTFKDADGSGTHVTSFSQVGPTIADDIKSSSYYATVFALLLIFLYIFIRFSKWQYSLGAVTALFHDVLIVLGVFSLFHGIFPFSMEIDQAFIAAILTVIGYSINDTVVVFDRVREYKSAFIGSTKEEIINNAINSTVSRTIITSLTTLFVVAILFVFGGGSIKGFAFALLIGIVVGTYSSVFIATPVMSDLSGNLEMKATKKSRSFSKAAKAAR